MDFLTILGAILFAGCIFVIVFTDEDEYNIHKYFQGSGSDDYDL